MVLAIYLVLDGHNNIYGLGNHRLIDVHFILMVLGFRLMDGHNNIYGLSVLFCFMGGHNFM
jgi:hypothetical protein